MIWRLFWWGLLLVLLAGCILKSREHPTATSKFFLEDTIPPKIVLHQQGEEGEERGITPTPRATITLTGQAVDDSPIASVKVNNKEARLDDHGSFSIPFFLKPGLNTIRVTAVDIHNNQASKIFRFVHQMNPIPVVPTPDRPQSYGGNYYALVIGINYYQHLPRLKTAVNDARAVTDVLRNQYGFQVTTLLDSQATRNNIVSHLNQLIRQLDEDQHLLIYYAGHGFFDNQAQEAYWQPYDADATEDTDWIISDRITSIIKRSIAKNILIVADSCYSGTLTRQGRGFEIVPRTNRQRYLEKMLNTRSRLLIASGGNEPVSDFSGGKHSIFAKHFLNGLQNMNEPAFTAEELFTKHIEHSVQLSSSQTPNFQEIRKSGHQGGDFVFQKK